MASGIKVDAREFNRTLSKYQNFSKRDQAEIVNTKAYFIARRAVVETIKADKGKIKAFFDRSTQKIVGMIINKRRAEQGKKGLYGDAMAEAQAMMKARRLRSVGFMKSGWIWCIKNLEGYVKSKRGAARSQAGSVKIWGKPHGKAKPAVSAAWVVKAIINNFAESKDSTTPDPLGAFGLPALQRAVDFETASMKQYMEDKLRKSAHEAGIKTN